MNEPVVNLGQSQFQDTFFVAQAPLTPYRQLRTLNLEINGLEDALKRVSIQERRLELKIAKLDPQDPEQALDIEEHEWNLKQQVQLKLDAEARLANFQEMKRQLLEGVPQEYWDMGYESHELQHWVQVIARDMTIMRITGQVNMNAMTQLLALPQSAQHEVLRLSQDKAATFVLPYQTQASPSLEHSTISATPTGSHLRLVQAPTDGGEGST